MLDPASSAAFENLIAGGFNAEGLDETSQRAARLLSLLNAESEPTSRSLLIDVTMARVLRASERDLAGRIHPVGAPEALADESARSVDELVRSGWRARSTPATALLSLLEEARADAGDRSRLIEATLGRVQGEIEASRNRFRLTPDRSMGATRGGYRLTDLVAAAAAVLLAASVIWPMLAGARQQSRDTVCAANLARAAMGFSHYAADHRDALPQVNSSFMGGTWWDVGSRERSHSANLYLLVKGGYASLADLSCPGNPAAPTVTQDQDLERSDWMNAEEISFSYQLPRPGRLGWSGGASQVVLADRSPIVRRSRLGEIADPHESSRNHDGRGQNILFADGSIRFQVSPLLPSGDNIWLPGSGNATRPLTGREMPSSDQDAFVGP